jgi:hypothetical protein
LKPVFDFVVCQPHPVARPLGIPNKVGIDEKWIAA